VAYFPGTLSTQSKRLLIKRSTGCRDTPISNHTSFLIAKKDSPAGVELPLDK
jgi:hypothetical protein